MKNVLFPFIAAPFIVLKRSLVFSLLLLAAICLASCLTPQQKQMVVSLEQLGLTAAVATGRISPGDALIINQTTAVLTSGETTSSKVVSLGSLGLAVAADKGIISPGDSVLIQEAGAIITKGFTPPVTSAKEPLVISP